MPIVQRHLRQERNGALTWLWGGVSLSVLTPSTPSTSSTSSTPLIPSTDERVLLSLLPNPEGFSYSQSAVSAPKAPEMSPVKNEGYNCPSAQIGVAYGPLHCS